MPWMCDRANVVRNTLARDERVFGLPDLWFLQWLADQNPSSRGQDSNPS